MNLKWQLKTQGCVEDCVYKSSALFCRIARIHSYSFVGSRSVGGNAKKPKPQQRLLSLPQPTTKQTWVMSENSETRTHRCFPQFQAGRTTPYKMANS